MCSKGTKTYLTKWESEDGEFDKQHTITIHNGPSDWMVMSNEGFYLAVTTEDLEVKSVNTWYMQVDWTGKAHDHKITSVAFTDDTWFMMTTCED